MEEEIKELKHRIEVLSGVVFILLKETGLLEKAMKDNSLLRTVVERTIDKEEITEDKKDTRNKEDEYKNILNDFDSKDAVKN